MVFRISRARQRPHQRLASVWTFATFVVLASARLGADEAAPASLEELTVIAHPLSGEGLSQAAVVLEGERLERRRQSSIGATVSGEPGIHSAAFGDAVGRPVVHGLSGARVRVMEDRIDALDASVTSADHAVGVDPLIAQRIEILKGPSTLLYGSGAIGGVVDVHTGRIPHRAPGGLSGRASLRVADNGDRVSAVFRLDGGGDIAWHLDGFSRAADEYHIPVSPESARQRALEGEAADHDPAEPSSDRLPGSDTEGRGGAFGLSRVGADGFLGIAISTLHYEYGLPGGHEQHHGADLEAAAGNSTLDMDQTRVDFEAGVMEPFAGASSLNVRFAINDYQHAELEPGGEVGTVFTNDAHEGRVEWVGKDYQGWDGVLGLQYASRDFSATGEEAFTPPVETWSAGLFWVGERAFEGFDLETGARLERTRHAARGHDGADFTTLSAGVGLVIPVGGALLGIQGGYSSRAPVAEELYSNGPHLVSRSYEVGDPGLDAEIALNAAATMSWQGERALLTATAYVTAFRKHIYQFASGALVDDLPVMRYGQRDAVYRGIDLQASATIAEGEAGVLTANALFDTVVAKLDVAGNDHVPRLPPSRFGAGLQFQRGSLTAAIDYTRVFKQHDTADFELPTDAYGDLQVHLGTKLSAGGADLRVFFQGRNLGDAEQRHHSSQIKDLAPLPGRTLEVGMRLIF